jgi:hypothetical protein
MLVTEFSPYPLTQFRKHCRTSWRLAILQSWQKAACRLSGETKVNSRHTVNPRKIAKLASTLVLRICFFFK